MIWNQVRLADICTMRTGKLDSNAADLNGLYPFFTCAQETFHINEYAFDTEAVLLGGNNAAGIFPLKYYNGQFNAYQRTYVIETLNKEVLDTRFLFYSLRPALSHFQSASIGAATQYLTKTILDNFKIALLPINLQRKITNILSNYDELIENNRRRIQLLEESARLLYKEWFVYLRFPGHEHVKLVNGVPEHWERVAVSDIIEIDPKEKIEKNKEAWYVPMAALSELGMIINTQVIERRIDHTNVKFRNGDVLFARITPCLENGKTGFVQFLNEDEVACGSTEFIILRGRSVSKEVTYCLARDDSLRERARYSMIGSSGRQRVQLNVFNNYFLPLPPLRIREEFDEIVSPCFVQIKTLFNQTEKLKQALDLLLPRLMNGEIAV
jgi:type I restriction enzyme, S subunit